MNLKVLTVASFLLLQLSLVQCQWYGGYDCGQYSQQFIVVNPYGYDDVYSQYNTYPYNDPQFYGGYPQTYPQYPAQPIVVVVNNDRSDCDVDDILSLIFPIEEKKKEVFVPMPIVIETRDGCECKCECRCECVRSDYCPHCDSPKNRCKCKEDCQCKKKERKQKCKNCECQKQDSGCGCGGSIFHRML